MRNIKRSGIFLAMLLSLFSLSVLAQSQTCGAEDYECKIAAYQKMVAADPKDIEAYYQLGLAYHGAKKTDLAIATLNKYIAMNPSKEYLADAYYYRGLSYRDNNLPDKAIVDFTSSLAINPKYTFALINRGLAYKDKSDYLSAIASFNAAIQISPGEPECFYNRGLVYRLKGDYTKAIADFDKYISMNTSNSEYIGDGYYQRGIAYTKLGNFAKAVEDMSTAIRLYPTKAVYYLDRADAYRKQGKTALADADAKKAAELQQ
jgi:tetratricopeptide (TPR) repeat protein